MSLREASGLLGLALAFLALGSALLAGIGLARDRGTLLRATGLALVTGWAATGLLVSFELMAGLAGTVPEVAAGWVALTAAALLVARRPRPAADRSRRPGGDRSWPAVAAQVVLGGYLAALLVRALVPLGHLNPDAWTQWLLKAKVIVLLGGLDSGTAGFTEQVNADYPPLHPALEATAFRFAGRTDFLALPLLHWIVFVAFLGAIAFLLRPRVAPAALWPSLAMLALAPKLTALVGSSLADEPLALLIGLAGLTGALWLVEDDVRLAALACLFLGAAALTKNEGLLLGLTLAVVLAAAARRPLGLALVVAPLVAYAPWKLWLRAHDVSSNFGYSFGRLLHPSELADRTTYLRYGSRSLLVHLFSPGEWLLIVPVALLVGAVVARRRSLLGAVALVFPLLVFVGYSVVYWIGNGICTWMPGRTCDGSWRDVEWLVSPSADRIVASVAVLLAAIFPLLLAHAGIGGEEAPGAPR